VERIHVREIREVKNGLKVKNCMKKYFNFLGPLTCRGSIVGITSHGYDCGLPKFPGIYMDVAYYREFIMTGKSSSSHLIISNIVLVILLVLTYF
jgi:hypothetical protein